MTFVDNHITDMYNWYLAFYLKEASCGNFVEVTYFS